MMALVAAAAMALLAPDEAGSDWPQFQFNAQNHGRTDAPPVEPPFRLRWVWFGEGKVVAPRGGENSNGRFGALPREPYGKLGFTMQGMVAGGRVFFGDLEGKLFCLSTRDGSEVWKASLPGAIVHAVGLWKPGADPARAVIVVPCLDGAVYGLDWDGKEKWKVLARRGFVTPAKISGDRAIMGSLDGTLYAVDIPAGKLAWTYDAGAPLRQPCAIADGRVFFGSEDMTFHAVGEKDGKGIWKTAPGLMKGQSFRNTWPMAAGDKVMTYQILVNGMAEFVMEGLLWHATPGSPAAKAPGERKRIEDWPKEREAILKWLEGDDTYAYTVEPPWSKTPGVRRGDRTDPACRGGPFRKSLFVFDAAGDGKGGSVEPYQVPMGIVGGTGNGNVLALDARGRPLTFWRVSAATVLKGGTFGSAFTPDLSALDLRTGDRLPYPAGGRGGPGVELDNHHVLTTAGDMVYWFNPFRQARWIRLDGKDTPHGTISAVYGHHDGGGWSGDVVYWAKKEAAGPRAEVMVDTHGAARTPAVVADGAVFVNELDIRAFACYESARGEGGKR
jgi:outer membrane protein assembly factor BamB